MIKVVVTIFVVSLFIPLGSLAWSVGWWFRYRKCREKSLLKDVVVSAFGLEMVILGKGLSKDERKCLRNYYIGIFVAVLYVGIVLLIFFALDYISSL